MFEVFIPIPGLFQKYTGDTMFYEIESIFYMVIDHHTDPETFTDIWFWPRIFREMIHEIYIFYRRKVCMNPMYGTRFFPILVIRSSRDNRQFYPSFFEKLYSILCVLHEGDTLWIESFLPIGFPDETAISFREGRIEPEKIILGDIFERSDTEKLSVRVSLIEHPHDCTRERLIEIETDMVMLCPVEACERHAESIGKNKRK